MNLCVSSCTVQSIQTHARRNILCILFQNHRNLWARNDPEISEFQLQFFEHALLHILNADSLIQIVLQQLLPAR